MSVPEPGREICHLNAAWNVKGEKEMTHQRRSPPHLKLKQTPRDRAKFLGPDPNFSADITDKI